MNVLAIETSTVRGTVAALADGNVVFHEAFACERGHSSDLFLHLDTALRALGRCDRVVVGLGPGSYSGVRIAIAAAIGIGFGTGAELVGIPSVVAIETEAFRYRVIGDARRGAFYFAEVNGRDCVEGPALISPTELEVKLASEVCPLFASAPLPAFPQAQLAFPSALELARLAANDRGICNRRDLEPIYLRDVHITQPRCVPEGRGAWSVEGGA